MPFFVCTLWTHSVSTCDPPGEKDSVSDNMPERKKEDTLPYLLVYGDLLASTTLLEKFQPQSRGRRPQRKLDC